MYFLLMKQTSEKNSGMFMLDLFKNTELHFDRGICRKRKKHNAANYSVAVWKKKCSILKVDMVHCNDDLISACLLPYQVPAIEETFYSCICKNPLLDPNRRRSRNRQDYYKQNISIM